MKKSGATPAKLRNIANLMKTSNDSLFGSNIFSNVTLSAVHNELQHSNGGLSVASIFKRKGRGKAGNSSSDIDVSEDCVIVPQGSTGIPREAAKRVQYSEQTLAALSKLEALEKEIEAEEPYDSSDDDVVCWEAGPDESKVVFRVLGPARLIRFALDPDARMAGALEEIAKECGVPVTRVVVCDDEGNTVEPGDKAQSLTPGAIYQCIVRPFTAVSSEPPVPSVPEKSTITVKFQCASRRKPELIKIAEDEPLREGAREFAEIAGLDPANLVMEFDGERVDPAKTPKELGFEDGDCVDVSVAKR